MKKPFKYFKNIIYIYKMIKKLIIKKLNFQIPATIPYDYKISNDPTKKMKKGEESKWLKMVIKVTNDIDE
jgi:hypothetical protein